MFSSKFTTKSTLICGPAEFTKSFVFEAAIHWAEQGKRVVYITQAPLESLPSTYHDRNKLSADAFKLMRFMYLPTYETLLDQLVDLHTFAILPSVVLIDDLDAYICDPAAVASNQEQHLDVHAARLCAFIRDTTNACSRILKTSVHLCVSTTSVDVANGCCRIYFNVIWQLRVADDVRENRRSLELRRYGGTSSENDAGDKKIFGYERLTDGTLVLERIYEKFDELGICSDL